MLPGTVKRLVYNPLYSHKAASYGFLNIHQFHGHKSNGSIHQFQIRYANLEQALQTNCFSRLLLALDLMKYMDVMKREIEHYNTESVNPNTVFRVHFTSSSLLCRYGYEAEGQILTD